MPTTRGERRHVVHFENPGAPVSDGEGGFTESWTPVTPATWYVAIRPATARDAERAGAGTVITHASHIVTGDYHPDVTTKTRMMFNGRTYQVTSALTLDARGLEMELVADLQN